MPKSAAHHADNTAFQVLDKWFEFRAHFSGIPGLQVAIRKHGELIYSKAFGDANTKTGRAYTPRHAGHIASQSKMFTSCALLQLERAGALSLGDKASRHLPWLKKHRDRRAGEFTLRDLVSNRTGLSRDGDDSSFWEMERPFLTRGQLRNTVLGADLVYEPNTVTKYSNIGFGLLGLVIEAATQRSYDEVINELIFKKMPGAVLVTDYGRGGAGIHYADGHSRRFYSGRRRIFRHAPTDALAAATGFCGNMESTTRFASDLFFTDKFLPRAQRRDLHSLRWPVMNTQSEYYGMGVQFNITMGNTYIGHAGGYPGFTSQTRHWAGSDYICGAIVNANESFSYSIIRSMAEVLRKVAESFPASEWKKLEVTPPMLNRWGTNIYIIGRTRALVVPLETWQPADDAYLLDKRGGRFYYGSITGYASPGEEVQFIRRGKKVSAVRAGGHPAYNVKDFLKRGKLAFV